MITKLAIALWLALLAAAGLAYEQSNSGKQQTQIVTRQGDTR